MISKLRKLKGRSLAELADRGRQKAVALVERTGLSSDLGIPADEDFLRLFRDAEARCAEDLLERFRGRDSGFYPVFDDRERAVSTMRSRFSDDVEGNLRQAERILAGRFDLLGYKDLHFGMPVPDWHFEPVSSKRSPLRHWSRFSETDPSETGDKKIVWELNRHQYFTLLGRAYWLTGDETYTDVFVRHLEDWIERNPAKMGLNWVSGLEIAYRSISWIWAFYFFRNSDHLRPEMFLKMLKCLYRNARHLERHLSIYSSPNTHLTGEALGLYLIGAFLKGLGPAARWKEAGYKILIDALDYQLREDGGYIEQSTQYHRYTADIYLSLFLLRKAEGLPVDEVHERKLRKALEFLMFITQPNGETPLIGDDDGGRLHFFDDRAFTDFRSTLAVGAALFNDSRLKFVAGKPSSEVLWLTGSGGLESFDRLEAIAISENSKAFDQSGYYVVRTGWERASDFILIDCGEHGFMNGGHAHADAMSFVMCVRGTPAFADPGTCTYTADEKARERFRSSPAHNCLTVNGQSSSIPGGPFSWKSIATAKVLEWKSGGKHSSLRGTHDGYERFGVKYEREFRFDSNMLVALVDEIETASRNEFEISFTLAPNIDAEILDSRRIVLRTRDGNEDLLTIFTTVTEDRGGEVRGWRIEEADVSPRYGSLVDSARLVFSLSSDTGFRVENAFVYAGRA